MTLPWNRCPSYWNLFKKLPSIQCSSECKTNISMRLATHSCLYVLPATLSLTNLHTDSTVPSPSPLNRPPNDQGHLTRQLTVNCLLIGMQIIRKINLLTDGSWLRLDRSSSASALFWSFVPPMSLIAKTPWLLGLCIFKLHTRHSKVYPWVAFTGRRGR